MNEDELKRFEEFSKDTGNTTALKLIEYVRQLEKEKKASRSVKNKMISELLEAKTELLEALKPLVEIWKEVPAQQHPDYPLFGLNGKYLLVKDSNKAAEVYTKHSTDTGGTNDS